jgi:hypothetical protein
MKMSNTTGDYEKATELVGEDYAFNTYQQARKAEATTGKMDQAYPSTRPMVLLPRQKRPLEPISRR